MVRVLDMTNFEALKPRIFWLRPSAFTVAIHLFLYLLTHRITTDSGCDETISFLFVCLLNRNALGFSKSVSAFYADNYAHWRSITLRIEYNYRVKTIKRIKHAVLL